MFGALVNSVTSLGKAAVGAVVVAPVSLVADVANAATGRPVHNTGDALKDVLKNLEQAAAPDRRS